MNEAKKSKSNIKSTADIRFSRMYASLVINIHFEMCAALHSVELWIYLCVIMFSTANRMYALAAVYIQYFADWSELCMRIGEIDWVSFFLFFPFTSN